MLIKSLAVADPTRVQSRTATCWYLCNVVYTGQSTIATIHGMYWYVQCTARIIIIIIRKINLKNWENVKSFSKPWRPEKLESLKADT